MKTTVRDFSGNQVRIECNEKDVPDVIMRKLIDPYIEELTYSWMTGTMAEERVKNYVAYVGSLLFTKPDKHGILSGYKTSLIHKFEMTSSDPALMIDSEKTYVAPKKKMKPQRQKTVFQKFSKVNAEHPLAKKTVCRVDAENCFAYIGKRYRISTDVIEYRPVMTDEGLYFTEDKVIAIDDGKITWVTQNGEVLKSGLVTEIS